MKFPRMLRAHDNAPPEPGSWSVCSTVAEPTPLLAAFVAHYLALGAREIHLFLDDPRPEAIAFLRGVEGVRLTLCDDAYWLKSLRPRPASTVNRQIINANAAYADCTTEWFFFCDADEYLTADQPVSTLLQSVPQETAFVRPHMAERAFPSDRPQRTLFDGVFRCILPNRPLLLRNIYGDMAAMTTQGLLAHTLGKSFVRTGRKDLKMRIHFPVPPDKADDTQLAPKDRPKPGPWLDGAWLVHYDGMTPFHWKLKLLRYFLVFAPMLDAGAKGVFKRRTPARSAQLNAIYRHRGDPAELDRLASLARPDARVLAALREEGGLVDLDIDPVATAVARFGPDLDLSPETFDADLRRHYASVIAEHGLAG